MIKLSIFYPYTENKHFNKEYYMNVHIPLSIKLQGDAIKHTKVEFGISGAQPGSKPAYIAICHFLYDSMEAFQQAFMPHTQTLMNDTTNYTNIEL